MPTTHFSPARFGFVLLSLVVSVAARGDSGAPSRDWGPGLRVGEPWGFEDKKFFTPRHAVAMGFGVSNRHALVMSLDYLFHDDLLLPLARVTDYRLVPYLGLGMSFHFSTLSVFGNGRRLNDPDARFGMAVRFPVGLEWYPWGGDFGLAAEIQPGFGVIPGSFRVLHGGLIARYYY